MRTRGPLAVLLAVLLTSSGAVAARAAGVGLRVPAGGEPIPISGVAFVTAVCSSVGALIALACVRWSRHPARHFIWVAAGLTAVSLVPPLLVGADVATAATLVGLHLVAAAAATPLLAGALAASPCEGSVRVAA